MPKVSFRMASAYSEWVFGVQTNTARKIHRSDHDHRTDAPDPARRRLELAEVGLPDPVAFARRIPEQLAPQSRPGLAIGPKPRGSSSPPRRSARSTVEVDTA